MTKRQCEKVNCGSCQFHTKDKAFEKPCIELGKLPQARACQSYKPHVQQLLSEPQDVRNTLKIADAVRGMGNSDIQVLIGLLLQEKTTRKLGFYFHQKVYVRYRGTLRNYFSNFLVGYVLYATKEYIMIVGESGKTVFRLINEKDGHSFYTVEQFRVVRQEMSAKKMMVDPQIDIDNANVFAKRGAVSPLDLVDEESIRNRQLSKVKKTKGEEQGPDDIVTMVRRAERGRVADRSVMADRKREGKSRNMFGTHKTSGAGVITVELGVVHG